MSNISISEAAKILDVAIKTMQRWDEDNTFPALREEVSNSRFYDEGIVREYKKYRDARVTEKHHLRKLGPIRQNIDKYLATQPLSPGEAPKGFDGKEFHIAYQALDQWTGKHHELRAHSMKFFDVLEKIDSIRKLKAKNNE